MESPAKLSEIVVHFPELKGKGLTGFMRYKVTLEYNGSEVVLQRRFSDFDCLRRYLRKCLPFHYIHPLPEKRRISHGDTEALQQRAEELGRFLRFLAGRVRLFNLDGFWKFFDQNLRETKTGEIISKFSKVDIQFVQFTLQKLYPELFQQVYSEELLGPILSFKVKIDQSVKFCANFNSQIRTYVDLVSDQRLQGQSKVFFELLSCHYNVPQDDKDFLALQGGFQEFLGHNDIQYWKDFEKQMNMVEQEILTLVEVYKDVQKLHAGRKKLAASQLEKEREIVRLENSSSSTVGFLKKKPKSLKIQELKDQVEHLKKMIEINQQLLVVGADLIRNSAINSIKRHKVERFKSTIDHFARRKLERAKAEQEFWETLLDCNQRLSPEVKKQQVEKEQEGKEEGAP